jgi:hypothetical protein
VTAAWCGPIAIVLAREVEALINTTWGFTLHMLVAGKANHRPGTFHSRHIGVGKGKLRIYWHRQAITRWNEGGI